MLKFGRKFNLSVAGNDGQEHSFASPLTLHFIVKRAILPSLATARFTILNLSEKSRNAIYRDPWQNQTSPMPAIKVAGGYGDGNLPYIFIGNVKSCQSYRRGGEVDFSTEF